MMAFLTGVRGYLIVVLICISLIISDVEHFFMCLLAICMSSLEKDLFRSSDHFLIGLLHELFVDFLLMIFLTRVKWYLIAVMICISRIISDIEQFFMCLLAICMSSLEKYLFRSPQFLIGLFCCHWVVWAVCTFWKLSSCGLHGFKYFLLSCWLPFPFLCDFP